MTTILQQTAHWRRLSRDSNRVSRSGRWRKPLPRRSISSRSWWSKPAPAPAKPSLIWRRRCAPIVKVIISTGSKALQDQLYARDLPTVAKALKYKGKLALLKGRSNYLCLERLEQQSMAGGELAGQTLIDLVQLRGGRRRPKRATSAPAAKWRKTASSGHW